LIGITIAIGHGGISIWHRWEVL